MATNLITPTRCGYCREFVIKTWPVNAPHDKIDLICNACFAEYLAHLEGDADDYTY
ncbi:hypothetical protein [Nocardia sp. XZ_19_385]|uniref:hypothetical protein n=1 Tax=Nocardia sp. XZ_19_385 TaxID=2769488 RepID=UPI00188DF422|nr:hypothetical protein [Nocardia sp. XZ_19_385]